MQQAEFHSPREVAPSPRTSSSSDEARIMNVSLLSFKDLGWDSIFGLFFTEILLGLMRTG